MDVLNSMRFIVDGKVKSVCVCVHFLSQGHIFYSLYVSPLYDHTISCKWLIYQWLLVSKIGSQQSLEFRFTLFQELLKTTISEGEKYKCIYSVRH